MVDDTPVEKEDSILNTIKDMVGIPVDIADYDTPIKASINNAILILSQLGVGDPSGFVVTSATQQWSDYITDKTQLGMVRTYLYLKTSLQFDPPTNAFLVTALKDQITELEYRLNCNAEGDFHE
jgi:hypothetical protein